MSTWMTLFYSIKQHNLELHLFHFISICPLIHFAMQCWNNFLGTYHNHGTTLVIIKIICFNFTQLVMMGPYISNSELKLILQRLPVGTTHIYSHTAHYSLHTNYIVLHFIVLYCIVVYCIVVYCIVLLYKMYEHTLREASVELSWNLWSSTFISRVPKWN